MTTTLLIARHGETDWNRERRWQGHADPPLNDAGREQARALGVTLASGRVDAIWSSDLDRARATAEIVGSALGLPVRLDQRLREVDVGEWQGLTTSEIEIRYPEGLAKLRLGETGWVEGESIAAMAERVVSCLLAISVEHRGGRILVVTHGGAIGEACIAAGRARSEWTRAPNCSVHEVAVSSAGTLHQVDPDL